MKIFLYFVFFLIIACQPSCEEHLDSNLLSKSVEEVGLNLNLSYDKFKVLYEPLGIVRGIFGRTNKSVLIYIYIERNTFGFDSLMSIKVDDILDKKVVGIAKKDKHYWKTIGQVIDYYHVNPAN